MLDCRMQSRWQARNGCCALAAAASAFAPLAATVAQVPCQYQITQVIHGPCCPGNQCAFVIPNNISPNGRYVCGRYYPCGYGDDRAFVYDTQSQAFFPLSLPNASSSYAADVNDSGLIVGEAEVPSVNGYRAFVYDLQTGQNTYLEPWPFAAWSGASGVNNAGFVCGYRSIGSPGDPVNPRTAFVWSASTGFRDLEIFTTHSSYAYDINQDNWVAVNKWDGSVMNAFLWKESQLINLGTLIPGYAAVPVALNEALDVAGSADIPDPKVPPGIARAVCWRHGQISDLGTLPGTNVSGAERISATGIVIGTSEGVPFIAYGATMRPLSDVVVLSQGIAFINGVAGFVGSRIVAAGWDGNRECGLILEPSNIVQGDTNGDCRVDMG
jgi:uncharacterized membrane protein